MEVEKIRLTFKFGGQANSAEGDRFKPSRETMVRFAIDRVPEKASEYYRAV